MAHSGVHRLRMMARGSLKAAKSVAGLGVKVAKAFVTRPFTNSDVKAVRDMK